MKRTGLLLILSISACEKANPPAASVGFELKSPASGGSLLKLPAGEFTMGEAGGRPDETPHAVSLAGFWIDVTPVTQEQYEKIMGSNPAKRKDPKSPAVRIQWIDAARFCNKRSVIDGINPCYEPSTR